MQITVVQAGGGACGEIDRGREGPLFGAVCLCQT